MSRRNILALDLGTATGWASASGGVIHASSVQRFPTLRFEGGGMRFLRFRRWLRDMLHEVEATEVVYEEVRRHVATDAAHVYGGFLAHLQAVCEENRVAYAGVPVQTIKKYATGKGNAPKEAMIAAVRMWGRNPVDDNEADAIALARYWMEHGLSGVA
jgi:Holliday junction resolvasome RuvABC endonuclease subunit